MSSHYSLSELEELLRVGYKLRKKKRPNERYYAYLQKGSEYLYVGPWLPEHEKLLERQQLVQDTIKTTESEVLKAIFPEDVTSNTPSSKESKFYSPEATIIPPDFSPLFVPPTPKEEPLAKVEENNAQRKEDITAFFNQFILSNQVE